MGNTGESKALLSGSQWKNLRCCLDWHWSRPVYPYDFAIIFTGKIWNYGNYGLKIILREKKLKKNHKILSATISVKRQTAKQRFPACLASYTFTKMATKRTRVPTAILKITVFFLKLQVFFWDITGTRNWGKQVCWSMHLIVQSALYFDEITVSHNSKGITSLQIRSKLWSWFWVYTYIFNNFSGISNAFFENRLVAKNIDVSIYCIGQIGDSFSFHHLNCRQAGIGQSIVCGALCSAWCSIADSTFLWASGRGDLFLGVSIGLDSIP